MKHAEPPRDWQDQIHQRISHGDMTAFSEMCVVALPHLVSALEKEFPTEESHTRKTIAADLLLKYYDRPEQYDPSKLSLFSFLRMSARDDMRNEIDKQQRRTKRLVDFDDPSVELRVGGRYTVQESLEFDEWLETRTDLSRRQVIQLFQSELDPVDEQILLLMLEGVRETDRYAEVMGISHLDQQARRREVKRAKDRLNKKLRRLGKKLGRS